MDGQHAPGTGRARGRAGTPSMRYAMIDALDDAGRIALLTEIERTLAGRIRDIRLTGRLREIYRAASWRQRSRTIRFWLIWVTIFGIVTCSLDYVMQPALIGVSVMMRAIFIPIVYGSLIWLWSRPRAAWIEGVSLLITVAVMMIVAEVLGAAGGGAIHERYLTAGLFATATATIVFPLSRAWSIAGAAVVVALYLGFGLMNPDVERKVPVLLTIFFTFVIGCLVPARHVMNVVLEHAFVLSLRTRLQADELAVANARLAVLAATDGLTGLANRRAVEARLAEAWAEQAKTGGQVGGALLDIDHFKRFNDSAGHTAGDRCLIAVAAAIQAAMPPGAFAGRYGGEEFIAILPAADAASLWTLGERIRTAVADLSLVHPGFDDGRRVSVSVGLALAAAQAGADRATDPMDALLQRADRALYAAKADGRDRVVADWVMNLPGEAKPRQVDTVQVRAA
ncbi:GGDEF domain-containing protein [Methylobacterium nigriterrae]|uniref:GGDEF domain-containing protein n=1 Tax=Methylobacterium nigriterrae TaxID=3127512 RepID=UPI0030134D70